MGVWSLYVGYGVGSLDAGYARYRGVVTALGVTGHLSMSSPPFTTPLPPSLPPSLPPPPPPPPPSLGPPPPLSRVNQYMAFGLSGRADSTYMIGADVTVAWVDNSDGMPNAVDYYLTGRVQVRMHESAWGCALGCVSWG